MKRTIIGVVAAITLLASTHTVAIAMSEIKPVYSQDLTVKLQDESYRNLLSTFIYPYVEKAIGNFYNDYMSYLPGEAPYSYKFISFEATPYRNYSYKVVLEVQPYVGPHNSVGKDRITFNIGLDGVAVEKYDHLGNYQLPPNYQDIIKKPLPGPIISTIIGVTCASSYSETEYRIEDCFFESVNYNPDKGLLSFTIPVQIPKDHKFFLHVSGRMYMGEKLNGMSFHAFDKESLSFSWIKGKTYTYSINPESLDELLLVFGLITKNEHENLYAIHVFPDGRKIIQSTD